MNPNDFTLVEEPEINPEDFTEVAPVPPTRQELLLRRRELMEERNQLRQQMGPEKGDDGGLLQQVGIGITKGFTDLGQQANKVLEIGARVNLPLMQFPELRGAIANQFAGAAAVAGQKARELEDLGRRSAGSDFARTLSAGAVSTVPSMAVAPVGFPYAVAAAGLQSFGATFADAEQAYREQGDDPDSARLKAFAPALASGIVTSLLTRGFGPTGVEANWQKIVRDGTWKTAARSILRESGLEATEEWLDQIGQSVVASMSYDPQMTAARAFEEAAQAGLAGGIAAGGLHIMTQAGPRQPAAQPPRLPATPPPLPAGYGIGGTDGRTAPQEIPDPRAPGRYLVWEMGGQMLQFGPVPFDADIEAVRANQERAWPQAKFIGEQVVGAPRTSSAAATLPAAPSPSAPTTVVEADQEIVYPEWETGGSSMNPADYVEVPSELDEDEVMATARRTQIKETHDTQDRSTQVEALQPPPAAEEPGNLGESGEGDTAGTPGPLVQEPEVTPKTPAPTVSPSLPAGNPTAEIAEFIRDRIVSKTPISAKELFEKADAAFGGTMAEGKYSVKDAYDAMELGMNLWLSGRHNLPYTAEGVQGAIRRLGTLMGLLPTQTRRTAEMDEFQQFSTPPTHALLANWVANLKPDDVVLEPSAGVGGLAAFAKVSGAKVVANELSERRRNILKLLGLDAVYGENAEQLHNILPAEVKPTVVLMNPPFSSTAGRKAGERKTANSTVHIMQALKRLQPGGRLVAILGEGMALDRPTFKAWWMEIQREYNLRAVIEMPGEAYSKYGTSFGNVLAVIDKTGPSTGLPVSGRVGSLEELVPLLEGIRNDRSTSQSALREPGVGQTPAGGQTGPSPGLGVGTPTPAVEPGERPVPARPKVSGSSRGDVGQPGGGVGPEPGGRVPVPDETSGRRGSGSSSKPALPEGAGGSSGGGGGTVAGASHETGGDTGGLSRNVGLAPVSQQEVQAAGELTDAVYDDYRPTIVVPGSVPHPTPLSESSAMSAVSFPKVTYRPSLPKEVVLEGRLSSAQLESVVLAGQAHSLVLQDGQRRGFFIGDGTGVGKGRELSGIILDNWIQGRRKAVWISEKAGLAKDARRDLEGVGVDPDLLIEVSKVKIHAPIQQQQGIAFLSYDTLKMDRDSKEGKPGVSRLEQLVKWLGKDFDGVIAFDEGHNMGNSIEMPGRRGKKKPSQKALAGVALQNALPNARVVYVTATGATEVANLSYAQRLGIWGEGTPFGGIREFINQISSAGVAAMEKLAADLKAMGLYLARNLSFSGVEYGKAEHSLTPEQEDVYNELAGAWQIVLENMQAALQLTGANEARNAKSAAMSAFWGSHQRFFNQVITAMKMPTLVKLIERDLTEGRATVLQLVNTQEAQAERAIAEAEAEGSENLEDFDMTPRQGLMQLVERSFPVNQYETYTDENGNEQSRPVEDSQGNFVQNPDAVAMRDALLDRLGSVRVPDGPLEILLNHFGVDRVAEVTGRKRRVVWVTDESGQRVRIIQARGKSAMEADADSFMSDQKQILVFSQAGGTGRSYHADLKAKNQRPRVHYLVQPGWRADTAVQGFGRSHRSNQRQPPRYQLLTSNLPGEKRFISSIARRLDQLGALTKGSRQTGGQGFFEMRDNLESQYASDALQVFFLDLAAGRIEGLDVASFERQTGLRLLDDHGNMLEELPDIRKFLNRLLSLRIDMMNLVFNEFSARMDALIQQAIENGTLDVGLENLRALRTTKVDEQTVYREPNTGAETRYVHLQLEQEAKLQSWEAMQRTRLTRQHFKGYVRNRRSGKVWGVFGPFQRTLSSGEVEDVYHATGVHSNLVVAREDMVDEKYERLTDEQAAPVWQGEHAEAPKTYVEDVHLISGVILPIWDRLPQGRQRLYRVQVAGGERIIGRVIPSGQLAATLSRLGAEMKGPQVSPLDVFNRVLGQNFKATLANGWAIVRRTVSGDLRLEVIGPDITHSRDLERSGVFMERIQFKTRWFIPTDVGEGSQVVTRLLTGRPVVALDPPVTRSSGTTAADADNPSNAGRIIQGLDNLKIDTGGSLHAFGVIPAVWNAGIDAAKLAIRAGATVAEAVEKALEYIRAHYNGRVWDEASARTALESIATAESANVSPDAETQIAHIESRAGLVNVRSEPKAVNPRLAIRRFEGLRTSGGKLLYYGGESLLRSKAQLDLTAAYQTAAVKQQSDNLMHQLFSSARSAQTGWKLPQWFKVGAWARRTKEFKRRILHVAARLNATQRNPDGSFSFDFFEMRAGMMTPQAFGAGKHQVGDQIVHLDPETGIEETFTIGRLIQTSDGRRGYQLHRAMSAQMQQEIYRWYAEQFPELIWMLDMFIDPALANSRQTINGIQIPIFNRFAQAAAMADADPNFTPVTAYTPDVLVSRSLIGAIRGALTFRAGTRSPGRKYKFGTSREGSRVRDLLAGFNVRTFQMLQEQARKEWRTAVLQAAAPIRGGVVPDGWVKLDTGMEELWQAVKRLRNWASPEDWVLLKDPDDLAEVEAKLKDNQRIEQRGNQFFIVTKLFPETEMRMSEKGYIEDADYQKFFGEAARLRGRQLMLPKPLVDVLIRKHAAQVEHGALYRLGAWMVRNSTQLLLVHPITYVANAGTNVFFELEAATRFGLAGLMKLDGRDMRFAGQLLAGMVFNRFAGFRQLTGIAAGSGYMKSIRDVLPDQIFADSTSLADVKVRWGDSAIDMVRRGEVGGAALQLIKYGNIDLRSKQRVAYAYLKAAALTEARRAGLRGRTLRTAVTAYMSNPPMDARIQAVQVANFEILNYADSPAVLEAFAANDYGRLVLPFPRFGYHYVAKQVRRLAAVKDLVGRVPRGRRADALADLLTVGTFGMGGAGALAYLLSGALGGDDDDARQFVGASTVPVVNPDGSVTYQPIDRSMITSNRINLSHWARLLGIDDGDGEDFWWRTRNYPAIAVAGAIAIAVNDGRKYGLGAAVRAYGETVSDLSSDFFSVGAAVRIPAKVWAEISSTGKTQKVPSPVDPYATSVPLTFYVTEQLLDSFVPGTRQADELIAWIDPTERRKTATKTLNYVPGPIDAIRVGHWTGLADRIIGGGESSLPPAGPIDRRFGRVTPRVYSTRERIGRLVGFNVRPISRERYERAIRDYSP